ncbi:MAG TPA: hypothetical protein VJ836_01770 [Candidatus Saccharimonadales bacterium]|nr:hypothetical protein [Candidatus Saccharimonadales bacterium]
MKFITTIMKRVDRITSKQFIVAGVFSLALASSIGLGLTTKQHIGAAIVRDGSRNSIDYVDMNGGPGAANCNEMIQDIRDNRPSDLQAIYRHFGLSSADYSRFAKDCEQGTLFLDGRIEVKGHTVMTNAWTMGRHTFAGQRESIKVPGSSTTYYHSAPAGSFADGVKSLPVMVMFNENGVVEAAILNACGNPVTRGNKVTPSAVCTALKSAQPDKVKKPNTYTFTATASFNGNATFSRVVYHFSDDNTSVTKTSLTAPVEHTFKKSGKVTVKVYAKVPGGKEIEARVVNCEKQITFTPPFYLCTALVASALDDQKRKFRFTVKVSMDATTTLKHADFTLDGTNTTTGVTTKDASGNIYKDYAFTDEKTHKVVATVHFNTSQGVQSKTCQASVTPAKLPKCEVPGFEHLPPNDERCGYCLPGIPKGDVRCTPPPPAPPETPPVMPETGAAGAVGLFTGVSALGFFGHKVFVKRRARKSENAVL